MSIKTMTVPGASEKLPTVQVNLAPVSMQYIADRRDGSSRYHWHIRLYPRTFSGSITVRGDLREAFRILLTRLDQAAVDEREGCRSSLPAAVQSWAYGHHAHVRRTLAEIESEINEWMEFENAFHA